MRHFHPNYDKNQNYTEVKIASQRLYYLNLRLRRCYINLRNNLWRRGNNLNLVVHVQEPASIILSLNQVRIFEKKPIIRGIMGHPPLMDVKSNHGSSPGQCLHDQLHVPMSCHDPLQTGSKFWITLAVHSVVTNLLRCLQEPTEHCHQRGQLGLESRASADQFLEQRKLNLKYNKTFNTISCLKYSIASSIDIQCRLKQAKQMFKF